MDCKTTSTSNRPRRTYGWVPQLPDRRDHPWVHHEHADLPTSVDLRETGHLPDVYDQGSLGSCTANSIAAAFEYNERKAGYGSAEFLPSRLFIYYNERRMEGNVASDSGAAIRDGIKSINRQGVCSESLWPYEVKRFADEPPKECYKEAKLERALTYKKVQQSHSALKHALHSGQPICFGFTVYESFESEEVKETGIMPIPQPDEKCLGGHAVLCVGYDDEQEKYLVRNSWGDSWGTRGYFWMPYEYMTDKDSASDFWVVESISKAPACSGEEGYDDVFPKLQAAESAEAAPADPTEPISEEEASSSEQALRLTGKWTQQGAGEYKAGTAAKITWETDGRVPKVTIQYSLNSWSGMLSAWTTIVEATANHGSYRWKIPSDATADHRYYVRVLAAGSDSVYCESEYFSVIAGCD